MMNEENHRAPNFQDEIGELTRQKVVRQLHDGLTQTVSALAMRINYARRLMTTDPEAAGEELEKVEGLTRAATKEIRYIIYMLRPAGQDDSGLISEMDALANKMSELFNLEIDMDFNDDHINQLDKDVQAVIYQIVEELIDGARKINLKRLIFSLSLTKGDFAQLNLGNGNRGEGQTISFQDMDLNIIQSYASLIDGSVILVEERNQIQVLFPFKMEEDGDSTLV
jgi:signal transduction histidine kinase